MAQVLEARDAAEMIKDGQTVMVGGFGLVGAPLTVIDALVERKPRDLTIISNNLGEPGKGLGRLLLEGCVKKAIGSFFTSNPDVVRHWKEGKLEVDLLPQGTLSEAIRAGGAGIAGFYTPTGVGTDLAVGKEVRTFAGREYILETALRADVALIKAHRADPLGNLTYSKTARNFNPIMATAADLVIAEVDELVPLGAISPEEIVTPHLYVDVLVVGGQRHA